MDRGAWWAAVHVVSKSDMTEVTWRQQQTYLVMYGCESWSIKKAEHQRIDTFELWCWRKLLRVP